MLPVSGQLVGKTYKPDMFECCLALWPVLISSLRLQAARGAQDEQCTACATSAFPVAFSFHTSVSQNQSDATFCQSGHKKEDKQAMKSHTIAGAAALQLLNSKIEILWPYCASITWLA